MPQIINPSQLRYLESIRKEPDQLLKEMELFAAEKKIPILDWKASEFLELLIKIYKPKSVLEIGMAIGYSSIRIAQVLSFDSSLHTIEKSKDNIPLARGFIERAGVQNKIVIHEGDALQIIPSFKQEFDFIFLDADKEDYQQLLEISLNVLKKGGILFIDNLLWHGYTASSRVPKKYKRSTQLIRNFNKSFLNSSVLDASIFPIGDGIGVGIKK